MVLDFTRPIQSKSIARLPLQALINEVGSFERPPLRQLMSFNRYLLRKEHIPDLLAGAPHVGPPPHHELVADDAERKVIYAVAVVLPAHDFGGHVAGRARCV